MNNEFPKMLYKKGNSIEINEGRVDSLIVEGEDEQEAALAEGWFLTSPGALAPKLEIEDKAAKQSKKD